jgi:acetamidase/formamidase
MSWLHEGGANTKFSQLRGNHANQRGQRNHIAILQVDGATLVAEDEKVEAAFSYFFGILGTAPRQGGCDNPPRKIPYYRLNQSTLVIKK